MTNKSSKVKKMLNAQIDKFCPEVETRELVFDDLTPIEVKLKIISLKDKFDKLTFSIGSNGDYPAQPSEK
jgi:hypothetical protein